MANNYNYSQQLFPQSQGNVYLINNSLEVANIPIGSGISIGLCLSEGLMYLKSLQNGNPMFMAYKISNYVPEPSKNTNDTNEISKTLKKQEETLASLKEELATLKKKVGGNK